MQQVRIIAINMECKRFYLFKIIILYKVENIIEIYKYINSNTQISNTTLQSKPDLA